MDRKRDVLVGAVVTLGIAIAVIGTIWLQGGWGRQGVVVSAATTNVGQLMDGASVKFRGVAVGRVESIAVLPDGQAVRIDMRIEDGMALPDSAGVLIAPESMFGDWQAEIVDRRNFPRYDFLVVPAANLLPGAALPDLSRLTAAADQIAQNITTISDRVQLAFTEETALSLRRAIENFESVSQDLSQFMDDQSQNFGEIAAEVSLSAQEFQSAARSARTSFERIDRVLAEAELDSMVVDARASAANLRVITADFSNALDELQSAATSADSTFKRLDRIATGIEGGQGSIGRLFSDPAFAVQAEEALAELRSLLADLQENPSRYVRLSIF